MPKTIPCRVVIAHDSYNSGERVGLTFAEYERAMKRTPRLFAAIVESAPPPPPPVEHHVPTLEEVLATGYEPSVARGIIARQETLAAGGTEAEADAAASEATAAFLKAEAAAKDPPPPPPPPPVEREADPSRDRERKPSRKRG